MMQKQSGGNMIKLSANTPVVVIDTGYNDKLARSLENGTIYCGVSQNNYWIGINARRFVESVARESVTYKSNHDAYGHGICVKVKPNEQYSLSFSGSDTFMRLAEYDGGGNWLSGRRLGINPITITTSNATEYILVVCCTSLVDTLVTMTNIVMVEQ